MPTPHIEAKNEDIASIVIMPGDPLRAKYIAERYLVDYKLVNKVRNMFAYTGYYKGKRVTVMGSGMGCPSIGIYAYELYKFYNVETIIRVGSCGTFHEKIKLLDVILVNNSYSTSNFAKLFNNSDSKLINSTPSVNKVINTVAKKTNTNIHFGNILTSDCFDYYIDFEKMYKSLPENLDLLGAEMESFALFHLASSLKKKAACLLTVVDSRHDKTVISSKDRQSSLNKMLDIALESIVLL